MLKTQRKRSQSKSREHPKLKDERGPKSKKTAHSAFIDTLQKLREFPGSQASELPGK